MPKIGISRFKIFLLNFGEFFSLTEFGPPDRIIPAILDVLVKRECILL